jgi:hypothetical protein
MRLSIARFEMLSIRGYGGLAALVTLAAALLEWAIKKVVTFEIPLPVLGLAALGLLAHMVYAARWKDSRRLIEVLFAVVMIALGCGACWLAASLSQLPRTAQFMPLLCGWMTALLFASLGADAVHRNTQNSNRRESPAVGVG